jgi:hypothetical protein
MKTSYEHLRMEHWDGRLGETAAHEHTHGKACLFDQDSSDPDHAVISPTNEQMSRCITRNLGSPSSSSLADQILLSKNADRTFENINETKVA